MQAQIKKLHQQIDGFRDKELKFETYNLKYEALEKSNNDLRHTLDEKERTINKLSAD